MPQLTACASTHIKTSFTFCQPLSVPSLLDLRLRRDLATAWNSQVASMYEVAKRWC